MALPVVETVSAPVPMLIVLEPLVGRTMVPKLRALFCAMVTGWTMVVVPLVVTELDWANAGTAPVPTASAATIFTAFISNLQQQLSKKALPWFCSKEMEKVLIS
jgi:hypothetical protein